MGCKYHFTVSVDHLFMQRYLALQTEKNITLPFECFHFREVCTTKACHIYFVLVLKYARRKFGKICDGNKKR